MRKIVTILIAYFLLASLHAMEKQASLKTILSKVQFDPQPMGIKLLPYIRVPEGSIEVHFRDIHHLKAIIEKTPYIESDNQIYFVKDWHIQNGKEFKSTTGRLQKGLFIHVIADYPVKTTGIIDKEHPLILPIGSDYTELSHAGKIIKTAITSHEHATELIKILNFFDEEVFLQRTSEAKKLLKQRQEDYQNEPSLFPDLAELCKRKLMFVSNRKITIIQNNYLCSEKPVVYIASSLKDMEDLYKAIPSFEQPLLYIDPDEKKSGIYCSKQVSLQKGFEIKTKGYLGIIGTIKLSDYTFSIKADSTIWAIDFALDPHLTLNLRSGDSLVFMKSFEVSPKDWMPNGVPRKVWEALLEYNYTNHFSNLEEEYSSIL